MSDGRRDVWVIDAHYQIFRAYYSMPDLRAPDDTPVGAFRGYAGVLMKFLSSLKTTISAREKSTCVMSRWRIKK